MIPRTRRHALPSREKTRAMAAQMLRGLTTPRAVLTRDMAASVLNRVGVRCTAKAISLTTVHLDEIAELKDIASDLRVITHKREHYVILSEWASEGQGVLFSTGYDRKAEQTAATTSPAIKSVAPRNGASRHSLTVLLEADQYARLRELASQRQWSLSHAARELLRVSLR